MPDIAPTPDRFDLSVSVLIIGAGAAGLTTALAACAAGDQVLVAEADPLPSGSTALSAGLIPAAGTGFQAGAGIDDSADLFARDIQAKAHAENDPALVAAMARSAGPVIEWLAECYDMPFSVVTDFDYPGHSRRRMHGLPSRSGRELVDTLRRAVEGQGVDIICERRADRLFHDGDRITGARLVRPDGGVELVGCDRLVLACNGYGGNRDMIAQHMPDIRDALWFGHDGNCGEAVIWGDALGAETGHLGAYQGHGNVAHPHGILISWAVIMEGGFQVNLTGARFWNETRGYSEAARAVLAQPSAQAWSIFDARIADVARQFEDFRQAEAQGAIRQAATIEELAEVTDLPLDELHGAFLQANSRSPDRFGRAFSAPPLQPPFMAVRVTGALFHTQGGLIVDPETAQVRKLSGGVFANLYAVGGAACGVSGKADDGYLSGNGLLSAVTLGYLAGACGRPVIPDLKMA